MTDLPSQAVAVASPEVGGAGDMVEFFLWDPGAERYPPITPQAVKHPYLPVSARYPGARVHVELAVSKEPTGIATQVGADRSVAELPTFFEGPGQSGIPTAYCRTDDTPGVAAFDFAEGVLPSEFVAEDGTEGYTTMSLSYDEELTMSEGGLSALDIESKRAEVGEQFERWDSRFDLAYDYDATPE